MTTMSASSHFTFKIVDRNSSESLFRFGKTLLCIVNNSGAAFLESFFFPSLYHCRCRFCGLSRTLLPIKKLFLEKHCVTTRTTAVK